MKIDEMVKQECNNQAIQRYIYLPAYRVSLRYDWEKSHSVCCYSAPMQDIKQLETIPYKMSLNWNQLMKWPTLSFLNYEIDNFF